jgi:hypothetical protein
MPKSYMDCKAISLINQVDIAVKDKKDFFFNCYWEEDLWGAPLGRMGVLRAAFELPGLWALLLYKGRGHNESVMSSGAREGLWAQCLLVFLQAL